MDYHILKTISPTVMEVVFHVLTPTGTNSAGIEWCDCVLKGCKNTPGSVLPELAGSIGLELIRQGKMVEICENLTFSSPTLSDSEKKKEIEARHTVLKNETTASVKSKFQWCGYEDNVE